MIEKHNVVKGKECYHCTKCGEAHGDGDGFIGMHCPTSDFNIIRSHLEYGHKVEGKLTNGQTLLFVHVNEDSELICSNCTSWKEIEINPLPFTSITPIPHRYKKLEVGTKVDVLEEYIPKKLNEGFWTVGRSFDDETTDLIGASSTDTHPVSAFGVPLWAITPHVEGEKENTVVDTIISEIASIDYPYGGEEVRKVFNHVKNEAADIVKRNLQSANN